MTTPTNTNPLIITTECHADIVAKAQYSLLNYNAEWCGLIFGANGIGTHAVGIANGAEDARHNFEMNPDDIVEAITKQSKHDRTLIAVAHSHPTTDPVPSENDKMIPDPNHAYLIVGLKDIDHPDFRAWRVDSEYIGIPRTTEVEIQVVSKYTAGDFTLPRAPWALTPGNKVLISYARTGQEKPRQMSCTILEVSDDPADSMIGAPAAIDLRRHIPNTIIGVKSKRKTDPRSIALSRIRGVRVIEESPEAGRTRQVALAATELLYQGIYSDNNDDMESVQKYSAYITAAYPHWLAYN